MCIVQHPQSCTGWLIDGLEYAVNFYLWSSAAELYMKQVHNALVTILPFILMTPDSIRTMRKYGDVPETKAMTLDAKLDYRLKECRGQRNFYISGFTLFLIL